MNKKLSLIGLLLISLCASSTVQSGEREMSLREEADQNEINEQTALENINDALLLATVCSASVNIGLCETAKYYCVLSTIVSCCFSDKKQILESGLMSLAFYGAAKCSNKITNEFIIPVAAKGNIIKDQRAKKVKKVGIFAGASFSIGIIVAAINKALYC